MHSRARELIAQLKLEKHPEGGYFRRTHTAETLVVLPEGKALSKAASVIYYLLEGDEFSAFHRLKQDEFWFFHEGCPVLHYRIRPDGELISQVLGSPNNFQYQIMVPGGDWMAAVPESPSSYCLLSCAVTPAFQLEDWEMPGQQALVDLFPQHEILIRTLSRP